MKKVFLFFLFSIALNVIAAPELRGRPVDLYDDYSPSPLSYIIPILVLLIIGGIFLIIFISDVWRKYKDNILIVLFIGLVLGFIICFAKCSEENRSRPQNEIIKQHPIPQNEGVYQQSKPNYHQIQQKHPVLKYRIEQYSEICAQCYGGGRIECPHCKGKGWKNEACNFCKGTGGEGMVKCLDCKIKEYSASGLGIDPSSLDCISCGNTGYVKASCYFCNGTGVSSKFCEYCKPLDYYQIQCPSCKGQGSVMRTRQVQYYE